MRSRSLIALALAAAAVAVSSGPASSASQSVSATNSNVFTPRLVAVRPGETATFQNAGGFHNVAWDDHFQTSPAPANSSHWTVTRTFSGTGVHPFYCQVHGAPGVHGMSGIVFVTASGTVPAPVVSSASALGQVRSLRLRFRSTQPGVLVGVVSRRGSSGAYAFFGRVGGFASYGTNARRFLRTASGRALSSGSYRISLRVRSSAGLSAARTLSATVS